METFLDVLSSIPRDRLEVDIDGAIERIKNATYFNAIENRVKETEIYGETDGSQIWLVRDLNLDQLIVTILHEALHDLFIVDRPTRSGKYKTLPCETEHLAIYQILPKFP